jgi:transposase
MNHFQATSVVPTLTAQQLPDDLGQLKAMIVELVQSLQEEQRDKEALRHRLDLLLRRLYGPRGERFDPRQGLLFTEADESPATPGQAEQDSTTTPAPEQDKPKRKCRAHGRRRLPANLPRQTQHHELTEAQRICPGCGQRRVEIGVDKSEQLDYKPASLFVIEHQVHKYACVCCRGQQAPLRQADTVAVLPQPTQPVSLPLAPNEGSESVTTPTQPSSASEQSSLASGQQPTPVVVAAVKPAAPIAKGLPGPGLLAHLIVSKYVDHLPLHRLESIYQRQGLFLARSTLCDWLMACGTLLRPLYDRLVHWSLRSRVLHTDDTIVKLQDPKTRLLSQARMWVYLGDANHPYNVFDFTLNRKRDGPQQFLRDYQGYLQADAFSGYDGLYLPDPQTSKARILEVGCNAHARRKFYEARTSDAVRSHMALGYYQQLYALERGARDFNEEQKLCMRQDLSVLILNKFKEWIETAYREVLPKSPMAEALGYARNNWSALVRYTEAGFLDIDNNVAEREMKRIAIGRKNWLFVGSQQGGQMAAVMMSVTSTCKRLEVEPWSYLQAVLARLPTTEASQLDELLPDRWQAAQRAQQATAPASSPKPPLPSAGLDC